MMRPYQIYAVKAIVDCIHQNCGNGYIWHTTGSGKTLTSFKASTLLKDNPDIEKCLFVVDRKDLDRQTREEFNRFQEGCVEENTNTGALVRRLLSDDYADKVIVTTIQKLGLALDENSKRNKQNRSKGQADLQGAARTAARQAHGLHLRRMPPLAVRREPQGHQGILPQRPALRLHRHADLRGKRHLSSRSRASRPRFKTTQGPLPEAAARLHHHPRHRGPERPALPRRLLQARRQERCLKPGETLAKQAVVEAILAKHDAATGGRTLQRHPRHRLHQRRHRVLRAVQDAPGRAAGRRPRLRPAEHRLRLLAARRGQQGRAADSGRPAAGKGGQRARPRGEEGRAQGHHRRLQRALRHQPQHQRVRPLLPGRPKAHQGPAVPQSPTCPARARRRSTSPSSWTCCSPASTPST